MAPSLIMCLARNYRFAQSALSNGWLYGAQLPSKTFASVYFADQDWRKPDRARYMASLALHRPAVATVLDIEYIEQLHEVLDWAEEAAQYVESVVVIPKVHGVVDYLPRWVGGARIVLGYSVPTRYAGTNVGLWEFSGWPVHLLGGSPEMQFAIYALLSGRQAPGWLPRKSARFYQSNCMFVVKADVVSLDGNMASKMATSRASFWSREKGRKGHWVNLREIGLGDEHDAPYKAFDLSMQNIMEAWSDYVA
jgi:hypothetical protein